MGGEENYTVEKGRDARIKQGYSISPQGSGIIINKATILFLSILCLLPFDISKPLPMPHDTRGLFYELLDITADSLN